MFDVGGEPATRPLLADKPSILNVGFNLQPTSKVLGGRGQIDHHRHLANWCFGCVGIVVPPELLEWIVL